ncbi:MAG: hypothetical protein L6R42_005360, partial [Xanthoria sp. 1 TBL-2021]
AVDTLIRDQQHDNNNSPPPPPPTNLPHLRRIIPPSALPSHLRLPEVSTEPPSPEPTLHLLITPTPSVPLHTLQSSLSALLSPHHPPTISKCDIPLYPPTSEAQAQEWSQRFWPCVYRKYNPWGPQPCEVEKGEEGSRGCAGRMMGLAAELGREVQERGSGMGVGAVVVDEGGKVVVGAGDGRGVAGEIGNRNGNPTAHAVMRAIGMVASKRREIAADQRRQPQTFPANGIPSLGTRPSDREQQQQQQQQQGEKQPPQDQTSQSQNITTTITPTPPLLTPLEKTLYTTSPLQPGGYLCLDLTIYITHEPCVMCSMAILHSRFSRVVFGKRMPGTGGMSAEVDGLGSGCGRGRAGEEEEDGEEEEEEKGGMRAGNGYGLFWRPELNWRMLGWRWEDEDEEAYGDLSGDVHV